MGQDTSRLPEYLTGKLPPKHYRSLQHPCRRRILRALLGGGRPKSTSELARIDHVCPSVRCASYHLLALEDSGLIAEARSELTGGSIERYFSSSVGDNKVVLGVLRGMETVDRQASIAAGS
jgi:hypothetical protein